MHIWNSQSFFYVKDCEVKLLLLCKDQSVGLCGLAPQPCMGCRDEGPPIFLRFELITNPFLLLFPVDCTMNRFLTEDMFSVVWSQVGLHVRLLT